jgi:hypothetical protein
MPRPENARSLNGDSEAYLNPGMQAAPARDPLLDGWFASLPAGAHPPSETVRQYMKEIAYLLRDFLDESADDLETDIRACARYLSVHLLDGDDKRERLSGYRDALESSVFRHLPLTSETSPRVVRFMSILTDEFWTVYADQFRLRNRAQQRESMRQELRLAKEIQLRLLPKQVPEVPGFDIDGRLIPANDVGGDYWSCKYYEEHGIVTVKLADIAGHGLAAAMLVAAVKYISGGWYRGAETAADVIENTNRVLVKETPADILVTMFYGWLRPKERTLDVVNAGHYPVLFCRGSEITEIQPGGPALGLIETPYRQEKIALLPGDMVFCCSDGVIEARKQEVFGADRLRDTIRRNRHLSSGEICDAVVNAVRRFSDQRQDDISVVAVKALDPP